LGDRRRNQQQISDLGFFCGLSSTTNFSQNRLWAKGCHN
jgi:hypothetical protein